MSPPPIYKGGAAEILIEFMTRGEAGAIPVPCGPPPWTLRPPYRQRGATPDLSHNFVTIDLMTMEVDRKRIQKGTPTGCSRQGLTINNLPAMSLQNIHPIITSRKPNF
ncbi:hypothetical protein ACLOJK_006729 [Asimina triloba]